MAETRAQRAFSLHQLDGAESLASPQGGDVGHPEARGLEGSPAQPLRDLHAPQQSILGPVEADADCINLVLERP